MANWLLRLPGFRKYYPHFNCGCGYFDTIQIINRKETLIKKINAKSPLNFKGLFAFIFLSFGVFS